MKEFYLYVRQNIHPGSILVAIAFDLLWSLFEGGSTLSLVGIILLPFFMATVFVSSFGAVTLFQKFGSGDEWGPALSKALAIGVLAALPFSVIGMASGLGLLIAHQKYRVDREVILLGNLTRSWREIESLLRRLAPEMRGYGLDRVIETLYERGRLSRSLKDQLHALRQRRNVNVHDVSTGELAELVNELQAMESTLRGQFIWP